MAKTVYSRINKNDNSKMIILAIVFFCISKSESASKPYGLEIPAIEIKPEESTFKNAFFKVFRDKRRATTYKVLESPGLKSHFQIDEEMLRRNKRDVKDENSEVPEELPNPEKQVMMK